MPASSFLPAASLLTVLALGCASNHSSSSAPRYTPEVESAMGQTFNQGCVSPDQRWVVFTDQAAQTVVLDAKTGAEHWKGTGDLVYCDALGVVSASAASGTKGAAVAVHLRSYESGNAIASGQGAISGCSDQTYSPWPRNGLVGVEWRTRPVWGAAYPPGPDFDEEVKRCSATGALWLDPKTSAVEVTTISSSQVRPSKLQLTAEGRARIAAQMKARTLVIAIEGTAVEGKEDGCGLPLANLNLVARSHGEVIWTKPYGQSQSDCRP